ncbi:MAG: type III-A CRISPR-associated RAMP protein Csm3 [Elusimicrobia bacterium]|nr:type III-A CRISPR-associated RAMP protein Csm3 [Elusimicrobiota bacterium]
MKLEKIINITGKIKLLTGLHIGGGDISMHIGGTDNPVIKHSHTNEPYIPGSSLKGKMRSLLELKYNFMGKNSKEAGLPSNSEALLNIPDENKSMCENILRLFGEGANGGSKYGLTRLSFYDCMINNDCKKNLDENRLPLVEIKTENVINRITGTAEHPRRIERVPSGIVFDFKMSLKMFEGDDEENFKVLIVEALKLLQDDSLGGSGSRGYGKIQFVDLKWGDDELKV